MIQFAQTPTLWVGSSGVSRSPGPGAADLALANYVAAAAANGGSVSLTRQALLRTLIQASMDCGHWWVTDDMALFAAENEGAALTRFKSGALMTPVGTSPPVFTIDRDYQFNGVDNYIRTNWIPASNAINMRLGNIRLGCYDRVNLDSTTTSMGANSAASGTITMRTRSASTTMITSLCASNATFTIAADSRGLKVVSRANNATTAQGWDRGVALADATGLTSLATDFTGTRPFAIGAQGAGATSATSFRAANTAWAEWGAPLPGGTTAELAWYTALQTFMTAIGAQV